MQNGWSKSAAKAYRQDATCVWPEHKSHNPFLVSCFLYVLIAVLFAASLPKAALYAVAALAIISSIYLMHRNYVQALYLMILLVSIGPIVSVRLRSLGNFNIADVFLILLSIFFFVKHLKGRPYLGPCNRSVEMLAILFVVSVCLCNEHKAIAVPILNILQFALIYVITINVITTRRQAKRLIAMIALGAVVGAALHLVFYYRGLSLHLVNQSACESFLESGEIGDQLSVATGRGRFYRTSHFYGPFIVPCGVVIVLGVMSLWLGRISKQWHRHCWLAAIGIAAASLLLTGNRTVLLSCAIAAIGLFALRFAARPITFRRGKILPVVGLVIICLVGAYIAQRSMLNDIQRDAYIEAIFGSAHDSISQRFSMWFHACGVFAGDLKVLLFGIGPDLAWRSPDNAKVVNIMYIPAMRFQVPSYHSFYVDLILNFGIVFALVFCGVIIATVRRLIRHCWHSWDVISGACLCAIVMWLISWVTVSMAWGKPLLVLAQLLALAHIVVSGLPANNGLAYRARASAAHTKVVPPLAVLRI